MLENMKSMFVVARYDLKIFFRYKVNIIWLVATPLVYMVIGIIIFSMMGVEMFTLMSGGAKSGEIYSVVGYAVFSLANYCWQCGYKVENEIMAGTAKTNFLLPIPKSVYIYGLSVSRLLSTGVFTIIIFCACAAMVCPSVGNLAMSCVFLMLSVIYFLGIALIMSSAALIFKRIGNIANLLTFALQVLTGMMVPIRSLPFYLQRICYALPTTWAIDSVRSSLMGLEPLIPYSRQFVVLTFSALAVNVLGIYILRKAEIGLQRRDLIDTY